LGVEFYPFVISDRFAPECLDTDWLLGQFGMQLAAARRANKKFVLQGRGLPSPLLATKHQRF
jgi:putative transposase